MIPEPTVYVVDDEEIVRDSVQFLLESINLKSETFESAESFLEAYSPYKLGCLLLDVRMSGMSGLQLLERLSESPHIMPIIIITGHGDVPMAVKAMKGGAVDFLQKPYNDQELLDRVQLALEKDKARYKLRLNYESVKARLENLTKREHEILDKVLQQVTNKDIGEHLGISVKTVEYHRARVMEKMHAKTLVDLTRMLSDYNNSKKEL